MKFATTICSDAALFTVIVFIKFVLQRNVTNLMLFPMTMTMKMMTMKKLKALSTVRDVEVMRIGSVVAMNAMIVDGARNYS